MESVLVLFYSLIVILPQQVSTFGKEIIFKNHDSPYKRELLLLFCVSVCLCFFLLP